MTYPGTKVRERTALESSLLGRVVELEKERETLVDALRYVLPMAKGYAATHRVINNELIIEEAEALLKKYPL